jgi:tRNA(Ile)-lysidine synthase
VSESAQPTVRRVLERVRDGGMVVPGGHHVALVSGGRDSVCLLDALVSICGAAAVTVLHVNFGLRGADSAADERFVRELCERFAVPCTVHEAGAAPSPGNLQAWARDVRYSEADSLARARGALIATGHTASDQAETVLYRLAASPGRRALLGMPRREGRLIRPLLDCTRDETAAYCRERGLPWREDATNAAERFARGRIRHGLLEELRRIHPAAEANIVRSAELLRGEADVLDAVVSGVLRGRAAIPLAELAELEPPIARLVVVRLAEGAGGTLVPAAANRLDELLALAPSGGSAELHLGGATAIVEYGVLRFAAPARTSQPDEVALAVPGQVTFGGWRLAAEIDTDLAGEAALERLLPDGSVGVLDADAIALDELTVRGWRAGDRLRPIGLGGSKTLADLFADCKLPRAERPSTPLVASAGELVWIPGVATAQSVAVGPATTRVAVLTASRG